MDGDPRVRRLHRNRSGIGKGAAGGTRDRRSEWQRDRDRILYCSAFRRLAGITQVIAPTERQIVHNRLTHTLEVAQIARRLTERLLFEIDPEVIEEVGGLDPDVVEAGALAHDLGHPPFGHVGEKALDERLTKASLIEGFNGNAQSFRIVANLALRNEQFPGLDLTRASLNAILKYPWLRGMSRDTQEKWGVYVTEEREFRFAREMFRNPAGPRSAEADLVDWADDVAYAVHDLEDFFRAGLIPLDRLARDGGDNSEADRFLPTAIERVRARNKRFGPDDLRQAFVGVVSGFPILEPFQGRRQQRAALKSWASILIERYSNAVSVDPSPSASHRIGIDPELETEMAMLKQLTWHYVITNPALATQRRGYQQVIGELFDAFAEAAVGARSDWNMFPLSVQEILEVLDGNGVPADQAKLRVVADFIASMTEQQAMEMFHRLKGTIPGSALESIVS